MSSPEYPAHEDARDEALNKALDDALEELDRANGEAGPTPAGLAAQDAAAAAGDVVAIKAQMERRRRAGLRTVLSTMSTRMMAERTARAAEAAAAAAQASAAAVVAGEALAERAPRFAPFRTGFFAGLGLLLAYVTYQAVDSIRDTLIVISVAALIAVGLDPAVNWLVRRGLRRGLAVLVIFLVLLGVIVGAAYAIIPPIVNELVTFVKTIPQLITNLQSNPTIKDLDDKYQLLDKIKSSSFVSSLTGGAAGSIVSAGVTVAGILGDLFVVLVLSLFFLAGFPKIKAAAYRLAPASRRTRVTDLGDKVIKQMGGYLGGATIVAVQAGLVAGVFAAIAGLPFPWAIALGASVLDFVPVIGPIIVGISMTLIGFTQSLTIGIVAGAFYIGQHLFEAYWLYPRVMRRQVDISTGTVVVAILVGGGLLGVTGAVLAVPVAATIQLIIREVVMPMQERS